MSGPLLPRTWWNDEGARMQDLRRAHYLLECEERAWNAMVKMWEYRKLPGQPPPTSPPFNPTVREEKISSFP